MPSPPKLYRATVNFTLYVLASDELDAQGVAVRNATKELGKLSPHECLESVAEVEAARGIDVEWMGARPYSTPGTQHGNLSCADALREIQASARRADLPGQGKLFGGPGA